MADTGAREPLDNEGVLWVAAIDCVPIEERIEWVALMKRRVDAINAERALAAGVGVSPPTDFEIQPKYQSSDFWADEPSRVEPDPWVVIDWLAENNPAALELCPFKVRRG